MKKTRNLQIRTKIWIENDQQELLFGRGKTEILEYIETQGSIGKAAENIGMSYKKAWSHLKTLQENIPDELVIKKKALFSQFLCLRKEGDSWPALWTHVQHFCSGYLHSCYQCP